MDETEGKYNIKAVSKILHIQPGTLRAWERRYKIVDPIRNPAGHRLYTEEHMAKIRWLISKVNNGFTIGQAVDLLEREDVNELTSSGQHDDQLLFMRNEILRTLLKFEENKSNQLLDQAFGMFSMEKVVIHILGNILIEVGNRWEKDEISVAHEHYITSYLRTRIGMVFHHLPVDGLLPKVLCVCAPKEDHEMGLLIFTLYLKRRGYETIYLGSGIPEKDIIQTVNEVKPKFVFISCTLSDYLSGSLRLSNQISEQFDNIKVGIGGQALNELSKTAESVYKKYVIGKKEEQWDHWLRNAKEK